MRLRTFLPYVYMAEGDAGAAGATGGGGGAAGATGATGATGGTAAGGASTAGAGVGTAVHPAVLEDDQEPQPGQTYSLSKGAIEKRVARGRASLMQELFGTTDRTVIDTQLRESKELKSADDKRRRETQTREEQLQNDLNAERERRNAAEERASQLEENADVAMVHAAVQGVAAEYVKPKYARVAMMALADHLDAEYTREQLEAMNEGQREKITRDFFTKYAKDNEELAKPAPGATGTSAGAGGAAGATGPATRPLTNGTTNPRGRGAHARPAANDGVFTEGPWKGKTLAPNRPNSMTAAEVAEWKRQTGNNF